MRIPESLAFEKSILETLKRIERGKDTIPSFPERLVIKLKVTKKKEIRVVSSKIPGGPLVVEFFLGGSLNPARGYRLREGTWEMTF